MKRLILSLFFIATWPLCAQEGTSVRATTLLNADGTRTDIIRDFDNRKAETITYNMADQLIKRMEFTLNDLGKEVEGVVYDGKGKVLSRVSIGYDPVTGRMIEQVEKTASGAVRRRVVIRYDSGGRAVGADVYDGQGQLIEGTGASTKKPKPTPTPRKRR